MLTESKFRGCVIGQAVGDALGMPVERGALDDCRSYVDKLIAGQTNDVRHPMFAFGQYTDDSQLMREMLLSFVTREKLSIKDYAARISQLYTSDQVVGGSRASKKAALRIAAGASWKETGTPAPYARNGAAMRAAPVGLFFYNQPEQLVNAASAQARITHQDPKAIAGAVAIAAAVAYVIENQHIQTDAFLQAIAQSVASVDASFAEQLTMLSSWIELPTRDALQKALASDDLSVRPDNWEGIPPLALPSVLWSLYAFLQNQNDYSQTVYTAILGGGDTDTTAAMAGAISGAYLGLEAIPANVAARLTDQGKWGYEPLLSLSDLAFHLTCVRHIEAESSMSTRWAMAV